MTGMNSFCLCFIFVAFFGSNVEGLRPGPNEIIGALQKECDKISNQIQDMKEEFENHVDFFDFLVIQVQKETKNQECITNFTTLKEDLNRFHGLLGQKLLHIMMEVNETRIWIKGIQELEMIPDSYISSQYKKHHQKIAEEKLRKMHNIIREQIYNADDISSTVLFWEEFYEYISACSLRNSSRIAYSFYTLNQIIFDIQEECDEISARIATETKALEKHIEFFKYVIETVRKAKSMTVECVKYMISLSDNSTKAFISKEQKLSYIMEEVNKTETWIRGIQILEKSDAETTRLFDKPNRVMAEEKVRNMRNLMTVEHFFEENEAIVANLKEVELHLGCFPENVRSKISMELCFNSPSCVKGRPKLPTL